MVSLFLRAMLVGLGLWLGVEPVIAQGLPSKEVFSREFTVYVGDDTAHPHRELTSREFSIVVRTDAAPEPVAGVTVTPSVDETTVTIDWSDYPEFLQHDVLEYRVYWANSPFGDIADAAGYITVSAGTLSYLFSISDPSLDYYFAVVAVDYDGQLVTVVDPVGYYGVARELFSREFTLHSGGVDWSPVKQLFSREFTLYNGQDDPPAHRELFSREFSLFNASPTPPEAVVGLAIEANDAGDTVTLSWTGYEEFGQPGGVARYWVIVSTEPIGDVGALPPSSPDYYLVVEVESGTFSYTVLGLDPNEDYYFAVIPESFFGSYIASVTYVGHYGVAKELFSREFTISSPGIDWSPVKQLASREFSVLVTSEDVPPPVTGLTVDQGISGTDVGLDWRAYDEHAFGADVATYRVYWQQGYFTDVTSLPIRGETPGGVQILEVDVSAFPPETELFFAVVAVDHAGQFDPTVAPVSGFAYDGTAPFDVQNLRATGFADSILFEWDPSPSLDAASHRISIDGVLVESDYPVATTSYLAEGFASASSHEILVVTLDSFGNASPGAYLQAATWLPNPQDVVVQPAGHSQLVVSWSEVAPSALVGVYRVYAETTDFTSVAGLVPKRTVPAGTVSTVLTGLENGVTHYVAVTAVNISNGEDPSVSTVEGTPEADETGPALTDVYLGSVVLGTETVSSSGFIMLDATDPVGVSHVLFVIDDQLIGTDFDAAGGYTTYFDVADYPNGPHLLTVTAYDTLGNTTVVDVPFEVELTLPLAPTIAQPVSGTVTDQPQILVAGTSATGETVQLYLDGVATGGALPVTAGQWSTTVALELGPNSIRASATNPLGEGPQSAPVTVTYTLPDLRVSSVVPPATATADTMAAVTYSVVNEGNGAASGYWIDQVYLVPASGPDIFVATFTRFGEQLPGAVREYTQMVAIPTALEGDFHFRVTTDATSLLVESDETDNTTVATGPTTIGQPPRPNLIVESITAPGDGLIGQLSSFQYVVRNDGPGDAFGLWIDRFSARPIGGGPDVPLGTRLYVGALAAGESTEVLSFAPVLPSVPGEYSILVETDASGVLFEGLLGGESDNLLVDDETFSVDSFLVTVETATDDALSGTPIAISGAATTLVTFDPLAFVDVQVAVDVRGSRRFLSATTDGAGEFDVTFTPAPTEGGLYTLRAGPAGAVTEIAQDSFALWGFRSQPASLTAIVSPTEPLSGTIELRNFGDLPISGVDVTVDGAHPGTDIDVEFFGDVPAIGQGALPVAITITANGASYADESVQLTFTSDPGATVIVPIAIDLRPPAPQLVASPGALSATMLVGDQRLVPFQVTNVGSAPTEPLRVQVAAGAAAWLTVSDPDDLPALAAGQSTTVLLQLLPPPDLMLGHYAGSLVVTDDLGGSYGISVPFDFEAVSDQVTDFGVRVTDEYTYWSSGTYQETGGPLVANAVVQLRDPDTGFVVAEMVSSETAPLLGPPGSPPPVSVLFEDVPEGYYDIRVQAPDHAPYEDHVLITSTGDSVLDVFCPIETVTYSWEVTETEIEDVYVIDLDVIFETDVPIPVVTIDPPYLDLATIEGDVGQVDFTITNHGLVNAEEVSFTFGSHPEWMITPLVESIGIVGAQQSVSVPVIIERMPTPVSLGPPAAGGVPCTIDAGVDWKLVCLVERWYRVPVPVLNVTGDCGGGPGGGGAIGGGGTWGAGGTSGTPGSPFVVQPTYSTPIECEPCDPAVYEPFCITLPIPGVLEEVLQALLNRLNSVLPGGYELELDELDGGLELCSCCGEDGAISFQGQVALNGSISVEVLLAGLALPDIPFSVGGVSGEVELTPGCTLSLTIQVSGDYSLDCSGETTCSLSAGGGASPFCGIDFEVEVEEGDDEVEVEGQLGVETGLSVGLTYMCEDELEIDVCFEGLRLVGNVVLEVDGEEYPLFEDGQYYLICPAGDCPGEAPDECGGESAAMLAGPTTVQIENLAHHIPRQLARYRFTSVAPSPLSPDPAPGGDPYGDPEVAAGSTPESFCAQVSLQLEQTLTIARTAFNAKLVVDNGGDEPVTDFYAQIDIRDEFGESAIDRFAIGVPELYELTGVDGDGVLAPQSLGWVNWFILPTYEAAPEVTTRYYVSGIFGYEQGGIGVAVPLTPIEITVQPDARLALKYFWQRDVYADDPFTDTVIEPSEPFSVGLSITNDGAGEANDVSIVSAQPRITENESGLLIEFELIGTQVGDEEVSPSFEVDFGDIPPGATEVARFLLTSTLQGTFVEFEASYEHLTGLGDPRTSLIDSLEIFELIHAVRAEPDDGKYDFMTNELHYGATDPELVDPYEDPSDPELRGLPDTVHLSNGTVEVVTPIVDLVPVLQPAGTPVPSLVHRRFGNAQVRIVEYDVMAAHGVGGWRYFKAENPLGTADPLTPRFELAYVIRDDRSFVPPENFWLTDRTFDSDPGERRFRLHIFDAAPVRNYTLVFVATP